MRLKKSFSLFNELMGSCQENNILIILLSPFSGLSSQVVYDTAKLGIVSSLISLVISFTLEYLTQTKGKAGAQTHKFLGNIAN